MPVSFVVVCPVWEVKRVKVPNTPDSGKRLIIHRLASSM